MGRVLERFPVIDEFKIKELLDRDLTPEILRTVIHIIGNRVKCFWNA